MSNLTLVIPLYLSDPLHLDFTRQTLATIKTKYHFQVVLVNNFCAPALQPELDKLGTPVLNNPAGNILASAWNLGLKIAFKGGADIPAIDARSRTPAVTAGSRARQGRMSNRRFSDYCVILNNDILLHPQAIDNLVAFAESHPEFLLWSGTEWSDMRTLTNATWDGSFSLHPHFSLFMVSPKTVETVGYFDENLKLAYFEDNDYHIRVLLAGSQAAATTAAKFYHYGSRTIAVDDNLKVEAKYHYQHNRAYMQKKWGIDLHGRAFSPPESILKEIYQHPFNNPKKSLKDW